MFKNKPATFLPCDAFTEAAVTEWTANILSTQAVVYITNGVIAFKLHVVDDNVNVSEAAVFSCDMVVQPKLFRPCCDILIVLKRRDGVCWQV